MWFGADIVSNERPSLIASFAYSKSAEHEKYISGTETIVDTNWEMVEGDDEV